MTPARRRPRRLRRLVFWAMALGLVAAAYVPLQQRRQQREAARLERTRDALRVELARLLEDDPRLDEAPEGGVLIGAPASFTGRLAHQLVGGLLDQTEIRLANLKARKRGRVRVKTFVGKMQPGAYALDVTVIEVRGRLKAGAPEMHYEDDLARVKVPVTIREGRGRARIRFQWESTGLAGIACGDVDVTENVAARVRPRSYPVEGDLELSLENDVVTAVPHVPDLEIRLYVEPSKASWEAVERLVAGQGFRCRTALKLVDVPKALQGVLDRGLKVKIPGRIFRPVRLPAGFRDSVTLDATTYRLTVDPRGLEAARDILWYGADVTAEAHRPIAEPPVRELPAPSPVPLPPSTETPLSEEPDTTVG